MQIIPKTADLVDFLYTIETFQNIDKASLEWLIEKSAYKQYDEGTYLFQKGDPVNHMQIIVEGRYKVWLDRNGENQEMGEWSSGYILGLLPFSRMKEAKANGQVIETVKVLELHKDYFTEMVNVDFKLTQELVGFMSTRIREFSSLRSQNEKLVALGKLSAGLAHELNNPSAAIVRAAKELYQNIHYKPDKFKAVITLRVTPEQTDEINEILYDKIRNPVDNLSILERQDAIDELLDWFDDNEVEEADDIAEVFVDYGIGTAELDRLYNAIPQGNISMLLGYLESALTLERLVNEIQESADRIAKLVSSVKKYSHMDRGSAMEYTDIKDGLINTLIILKYKIREKQIKVVKEFTPDLPRFKAFVGQLNQVWTNIIANAIQAMDKGGTLRIKTYIDNNCICVDINDTGHGIPKEIQEKIFDEFFTTKSISEGTGMGLDITKKIVAHHEGRIQVASVPGNTTFTVCFPMD